MAIVTSHKWENGQLLLNEEAVPILCFGENSIPWFKAKPVHNYLGAANITQTMSRVHPEDTASLKALVERHGAPKMGVMSNITPPDHTDYNEGKALYLNESGLYTVIMGSSKPIAKPFQRWVTSEVLPSIRKTGSYSIAQRSDSSEQLKIWLEGSGFKTALDSALAQRDDRILELLEKRDDRILGLLGNRCEQLSLKVIFSMQNCLKNLTPNLCASLSQSVCFGLSQKFQDLRGELRSTVSNPSGAFVDALRKAVKLPAVRRTQDSEKFPGDQRATPDEERFVESLSTVLTEELERLAMARSLQGVRPLPGLTYGAWKRCRNLVGSRCLALRKLTGDASKPLLWTNSAGPGGSFNGGGQYYVYLSESRSHIGGDARAYLRKVLKQKVKRTRRSPTVEEHIRELISSTPPETWPFSSSSVDAFVHQASEEQMCAEMED